MQYNNILLFFLIILILGICIYTYKKNKKIQNFTTLTNYKIPFVIYRTYKTKQLHPDYITAWNLTKQTNPDFKQILYTDTDCEHFIHQYCTDTEKAAYYKINPTYGAARADVFRYLLLYYKGGVYLDIKSVLKKPLRHIIKEDDTFITSYWNTDSFRKFLKIGNEYLPSGGEFHQWCIISAPKQPILRILIDRVVKQINTWPHTAYSICNMYRIGLPEIMSLERAGDTYGVNKLTGTLNLEQAKTKIAILLLTGPIVFTLTINPILETYGGRFMSEDLLKDTLHYDISNHNIIEGENHYTTQKGPIILK